MINKTIFDDYQSKASQTAIYPNVGKNIYYPILGLISEVGEFLESYNSYIYSDRTSPESVGKELGDIAWYISTICNELGCNLSDIYKSSLVLVSEEVDLSCELDDLIINSSKMAGIAKKSMRDDNYILTDKKKVDLINLLEYVLLDYIYVCKILGFEVEDVLNKNIEKLFSRKDRGVLSGSGDNR